MTEDRLAPEPPAGPLDQPLQLLPVVGQRRGALLERLELRTVRQLLWNLPRDYLDLTDVKPITEVVADTLQTVFGRVVDRETRSLRGGRTLTAVLLDCGTGYLRGLWFNQPWMFGKFPESTVVLFSGKPKWNQGRWEMSNPRVQWINEEDDPSTQGIVLPRYGLTEGLSAAEMRRMTRSVVEEFAALVPDPFPADLRERTTRLSLSAALLALHLPTTLEQAEAARRCLVYHDLLDFQIALALRRRFWRSRSNAPLLPVTPKIDARIRRLFPFPFTAGQDRAVQEIAQDLVSGQTMQRLLQADVGAGKTAVAVYAMLAAIAAGYQACLMAPTELLTMQHWQTVERLLQQSRVQRLLFTGRLTAKERTAALEQIQSGTAQLVVGTQSLIQKDVVFAKLGLAIVDEQHRFGVGQRAHFASRGEAVHLLVMTATPIPRSLSLTQFGDLDLTEIRELPPGRQKITTSRIDQPGNIAKAWDFIRQKLTQGRQLYIVCPRVGAKDTLDVPGSAVSDASAEALYQQLSEQQLAGFRVGMVHGQMDRDRRDAVMQAFREGHVDALVTTTVIEVGVDVPNANLMLIYEPEQFGLSQLHQLRGRIGRGQFPGYCFLLADATKVEAQTRLQAFLTSLNGFDIAEADFQLRGPGDILGTKQHGDLPLLVADLIRDQPLLEETRRTAQQLVESRAIDTAAYAMLKIRVLDRFEEPMELTRSG